MSFLINGGIPEGDLPVKNPSGAALVRYVENGRSYLSAMPDVIAASALVQDAIDGVVADAESEISAIVNGLGYLPPVAFTSGLNVDSSRFTVTYSGVTYAPVADAVPFTTTGTFNPAQWRVIQGVTSSDLASADDGKGAALVGFVQAGAGAVARTAQAKMRDIINVRDFGAVGDGVTDDTTAIQAAINAVVASGNAAELRFPRGKYKVSASLEFNGHLHATSDGFGSAEIVTTAAIDIFSGTRGYFTNIKVTHSGPSGSCFVLKDDSSFLDLCVVVSNSPNVTPAVVMHASNQAVRDCMFVTYAAFGILVEVNTSIAALCINGRITGNTFYGTGNGILVRHALGAHRPEGWNISGNKIITTGSWSIRVEQCLHLTIHDNVIDQSSAYGVRLHPTGPGIDGVVITSNYIAAAQAATTGTGVSIAPGASGSRGITIANNVISYSGYGVDASPDCAQLVVQGNFFSSIANTSIGVGGVDGAVIAFNTFRGTNYHLAISDQSSGKRIAVIGNVFPNVGSIQYVPTDTSNFEFAGNIGKRFSGRSSAVTGTISAGDDTYLNVPHGLAGTPDIKKVVATVAVVSGGFIQPGCAVMSVDATNITINVHWAGISSAGVLRVNVDASL